jgi:predicted nucleic acid-binding protein
MIILDTNVLSEQMRPKPSQVVMTWAATVPSRELFTTTISEGEMLIGLELMPAGRRRNLLAAQIENIFHRDFEDRILSFDSRAARAISSLPLLLGRQGRPIVDTDSMIAAIANAHGATVCTRNVRDFQRLGVPVVNPWLPL